MKYARVPLKAVVSYNDEVLPDSTSEDQLIRYIEIGDVREAEGIRGAAETTFGEAPSRARRILREGDVIVSTVRTYLRAVAPVTAHDAGSIASTGFAVLRARCVEPRFLRYAVLNREFLDEVVARSVGISYPAINASDLVRVGIPLPPEQEQLAIADYLERETAQIDAFIAKNQEIIALLNERRDAFVTNEVTGASLLGKRRPVDADWFESVPAHWEVLPLRAVARTLPGGTPKSDNPAYWSDDEGAEWISIADMKAVDAGRRSVGRRITLAGLSEAGLTPRRGPLVLFAMYASVGETALLRRTAVWNQAILGLQVIPSRYEAAYLYWVLRALRPHLPRYFRSNTQDNLNAAQVRSFRLPSPPVPQQREIASRIEAAVSRTQRAISVAERGIALARERRAALISAAVTGKIDAGVAV